MKPFRRIFPWVSGLCLIALAVYAASPSFSNFNGTQFSTAQNVVTIGPNALQTNGTFWGGTVLTYGLISQGGAGFRVNDSGGVQQFTVSSSGAVELDALTASTVAYLDSNKRFASLPNASGALTNNGAGVFGWFNGFGQAAGTFVASLDIPPAAWFIDNVPDFLTISNATFIVMTNSSDGWSFQDGVTNAIRTSVALDWGWDASPIQFQLTSASTGTNSTVGGTNVVYGVRVAALGRLDNVDSVTFSALMLVTNGISTNKYVQTQCVTRQITPGGNASPTNRLLIEIQRLGAATGDTYTNSNMELIDCRLFYNRTNRTDFPLPAGP